MRYLLAIITFLPLVIMPGRPSQIDRVLFIGNSITYLYQYDKWGGGWGVAASQPDKDYVHRVQLGLTAAQGHIVEIAVQRWDVNFDVLLASARDRVTTFAPDAVVVQVGDNAGGLDEMTYKANLRQLLDGLCDCKVIVTGVFYDGATSTIPPMRSRWNAQTASEAGAAYVPISDLYNGDHCAAGDYVCTHPDDAAMQEIANRILSRLTGD